MMSNIPFYLRKYDADILKSISVIDVDKNKGLFKYKIVFYDPTDDVNVADGTGLVKKSATGIGSFSWVQGDKEAENEDDKYPEIENISFGGLAVSDGMWVDVCQELEDAITS